MFSLIVNEEIKCGFWKTIPILSPLNLSSSESENFEISVPEILIDPDSGFKIPANKWRSVVFPIPEFPMIRRFLPESKFISGKSKYFFPS